MFGSIVTSEGQRVRNHEQLAAVLAKRHTQTIRMVSEESIVAACKGILLEWQHEADSAGVNLCDMTGSVTLIVNDILAALGIGDEANA